MINRLLKQLCTTAFGKIFASNILVQATTVLQAIIIARILGPAGKGLYTIIILWPTIIAGFSMLGLYTGIVKTVAHKTIYEKYNFVKPILLITSILGIIGTILSAIISPLIVRNELPASSLYLIVIFSLFVLGNNISRGFIAIDHGRGEFGAYSITRSILNPSMLLIILILYCFNLVNLATVILSLLAANFIVCFVRIIYGFKRADVDKPSYPPMKLFKYSLKFSIPDFAEPIYAYFDKAILALVLISYDLGIYTTAYSAASLINILSNVYATKIFSDVAAGVKTNLINDYLRQNSLLLVLGGLVLIILFPWFVPLVFGLEFNSAILPSQCLVVLCIIQGLSYVIERIILAKGYPYIGIKAKGISMLLFAIIVLTFKFSGIVNIYLIIAIVSTIQLFYLMYIIHQLKCITKHQITVTPCLKDIKSLYANIIKSS